MVGPPWSHTGKAGQMESFYTLSGLIKWLYIVGESAIVDPVVRPIETDPKMYLPTSLRFTIWLVAKLT